MLLFEKLGVQSESAEAINHGRPQASCTSERRIKRPFMRTLLDYAYPQLIATQAMRSALMESSTPSSDSTALRRPLSQCTRRSAHAANEESAVHNEEQRGHR